MIKGPNCCKEDRVFFLIELKIYRILNDGLFIFSSFPNNTSIEKLAGHFFDI